MSESTPEQVELAPINDVPDPDEMDAMLPYPDPDELDGNNDSSWQDPPQDGEAVPDVSA